MFLYREEFTNVPRSKKVDIFISLPRSSCVYVSVVHYVFKKGSFHNILHKSSIQAAQFNLTKTQRYEGHSVLHTDYYSFHLLGTQKQIAVNFASEICPTGP